MLPEPDVALTVSPGQKNCEFANVRIAYLPIASDAEYVPEPVMRLRTDCAKAMLQISEIQEVLLRRCGQRGRGRRCAAVELDLDGVQTVLHVDEPLASA